MSKSASRSALRSASRTISSRVFPVPAQTRSSAAARSSSSHTFSISAISSSLSPQVQPREPADPDDHQRDPEEGLGAVGIGAHEEHRTAEEHQEGEDHLQPLAAGGPVGHAPASASQKPG